MHKCLSCRTIQPSYRTTEQTNKETKPWVTQRIRSGCSLASFHLSIFHVTLAGISWCKPHSGDPHDLLSFCWFQLKTTSSRDRNRSHRTRPIWRAMWILHDFTQNCIRECHKVSSSGFLANSKMNHAVSTDTLTSFYITRLHAGPDKTMTIRLSSNPASWEHVDPKNHRPLTGKPPPYPLIPASANLTVWTFWCFLYLVVRLV